MIVDLEAIIERRERGESTREIGAAFGVSRQAIEERLRRAEKAGRKIQRPVREPAYKRRIREAEQRKAAREADLVSRYVGQRFGTLTVLEVVSGPGRNRKVTVKCDCGAVRTVQTNNLRSGRSRSCGRRACSGYGNRD